ncbi:competence protein ComEA|uniref:Competence protein ComEA n=1 Tax=Brenneria salicis ATCC 15712 = DSM 30166 TaxID=714314 RepID=A0A366IBJ0_9GAMM|nr:helix-hairpin-helix domain-containing protein [Brenneria salicis]NMN92346.1 competence protein ComEA [Brenneria salicis ATCC 15712 = DSM 30166]RBP67686.1 competence protein ComEA [Brenneria salicis ATCC 15712 = DSM 30166]RLM32343.1 competence protein ComEA [Brenneria salicis ATCC 15712 = DSM 30166]
MKKSAIKAFCLIMGMSLSGLPLLAQAVAKADNAAVVKPALSGQKAEKAQLPNVDEDEVSINTGTATELAEVMNGIGLKKAEAIVNYREQNGPFTQIEQLKEVPGIGAALVERNLSRLKL